MLSFPRGLFCAKLPSRADQSILVGMSTDKRIERGDEGKRGREG
jgi:hypothetical protein